MTRSRQSSRHSRPECNCCIWAAKHAAQHPPCRDLVADAAENSCTQRCLLRRRLGCRTLRGRRRSTAGGWPSGACRSALFQDCCAQHRWQVVPPHHGANPGVQRGVAKQLRCASMFCFETAIRMFYWSTLVRCAQDCCAQHRLKAAPLQCVAPSLCMRVFPPFHLFNRLFFFPSADLPA
jgi:hypothetical protein